MRSIGRGSPRIGRRAKICSRLQLLREHGIDHIYYAISGLAEKNPNFKQQFGQRVNRLRLVHVPAAGEKGLEGGEKTLVYKMFLHEGYDGYLTIQQLEKLIAGVVAKMPDQDFSKKSKGDGKIRRVFRGCGG